MAKRKRSRRRKNKMTIPLAPIIGLFAGSSTAISDAIGGNFEGAMYELSRNYTGYDPANKKFNIKNLQKGLLPLAIGVGVHKIIGGKLGLNRTLAAANVPFIRL